MARKTKTFQIEGYEKPFTVYELTVKQIIDLMQQDTTDVSLLGLKGQFEQFLPLASNLTLEELYRMAPSEIKVIWENFKEINAVFFELSQQVGMTNLLDEFKKAIIEDFGKLLAISSRPAIPEP